LDLVAGGPAVRTPEAAFSVSIVGVPWQDLAARANVAGEPIEPSVLRYKAPAELEADGSWDLLIGDHVDPPENPLMVESVLPRQGVHPTTGEALAPPEAAFGANSINGHERTVSDLNDLQYSCIFPLLAPRDCSQAVGFCDCNNLPVGNSPNTPLCQDPATNLYTSIQHSGKAYPGQRHVRLARGLGEQGVLASICARNVTDPSASDFAYRPAVAALIERIAPVLKRD
jgi:hypothetical protein